MTVYQVTCNEDNLGVFLSSGAAIDAAGEHIDELEEDFEFVTITKLTMAEEEYDSLPEF